MRQSITSHESAAPAATTKAEITMAGTTHAGTTKSLSSSLVGRHFSPWATLVAALIVCTTCTTIIAMQRGWRGGRGRANYEIEPQWESNPNFEHDTFTFVRVIYSDRNWGRQKWATDYPDSDVNFSLRLQQLTSMKVNPIPEKLELTDPRLLDYPFLYMIEPGDMELSPQEVDALRKYLLNGGFMMVDDFWGDYEYLNFYGQIKRVFPEFEPEEVPLEHEIFQCVYPMTERPQVPSIHGFYGGRSYEGGSDTREVNYKAIYDTAGRMMVFICHNTDLGDGWEREGENHEYFQQYAVPKSYPLGINIVTYAMTH
ncbi:MAG: DUF4159 domain-containing protein [Pirellulaceae bacterium]